MTPTAFTVRGVPATQGSMIPFNGKDGRARVRPDNPEALRSWRQDVANEAARAHAGKAPFVGPVELRVIFRLAMPKSRPVWMHNAGVVLTEAGKDLDKMVRAVGDALTASAVIADDKQLALFRVAKAEVSTGSGLWLGAAIKVTQLDPHASMTYLRSLIEEV